MVKNKIGSIRALYEQLRNLSEISGFPDSEARYSTPHTYVGILEELGNLELSITSLKHRTFSAESDLIDMGIEHEKMRIALGKERLYNLRNKKYNPNKQNNEDDKS